MKHDYTLFLFSNGVLQSVQSPSPCLFNTDIYSLRGKRMEELLIPDSIERLSQLENGKKTTLNLCAKSTGAIFTVNAVKMKFRKCETYLLYCKDNLVNTNSDTAPFVEKSVLETMISDTGQSLFEQIDALKTTRNIAQIKQLKESITEFYCKADALMKEILSEVKPQNPNFETFNFSLVVKRFLASLEAEYKDNVWVTYQNFSSAYVLGNRIQLLNLLEECFRTYKTCKDIRVVARLNLENDSAVAEFTILPTIAPNVEFSQELTDFSNAERTLLSQKAGCEYQFHTSDSSVVKFTVTYDSFKSYRLNEPDDLEEGGARE